MAAHLECSSATLFLLFISLKNDSIDHLASICIHPRLPPRHQHLPGRYQWFLSQINQISFEGERVQRIDHVSGVGSLHARLVSLAPQNPRLQENINYRHKSGTKMMTRWLLLAAPCPPLINPPQKPRQRGWSSTAGVGLHWLCVAAVTQSGAQAVQGAKQMW